MANSAKESCGRALLGRMLAAFSERGAVLRMTGAKVDGGCGGCAGGSDCG